MICQMKTTIMNLLWKAGWTTRLYSWGLVLSLCFLAGQLFGLGIVTLSEMLTEPNKLSISSPKELPSWRQGKTNTASGSNILNGSLKGNNHGTF